jgi:AraC family transcriptional regulator
MPSRPHIDAIERAIGFIESNLRRELRIESIASVAAYSPWHFQRLFGALVGEPVGAYIRRRRLTSALLELASTTRPIADVAWEFGFESQEAFTRAFKSLFGITPGRCRREGVLPDVPLGPSAITQEYLDTIFGGAIMEPVIKMLGEIRLVGPGANFISILSKDADNFVVIPELWDRLSARVGEIGNRVGHDSYGICDAIGNESERRHADEFFYMAGVVVDSVDDPPHGFMGRIVPPATYAVFTHRGPLDSLGETYRAIYGAWLPESGKTRAGGPDLELYDERFDPTSPASELDILIPIVAE